MFEKRFKEELSPIKPSPIKKQEILANIQTATTKPKNEKEDKIRRFPRWTGAIAACLAIAIICVAVFGGIPKPVPTKGEQTITDTAVIPATISYNAIYQLFQTIYKAQLPKEPTLLNKITYAIKGAFDGTKGSDAVVDESTEESIDIDMNLSGATGAVDDGATNAGDSAINNGNNNTKPTTTKPTAAPNDTEEHSGTNNQVYGVEEADVIKTDGKYIYTMSYASRTVNIARANKGELTQIACVSISDSENYKTFPDFQLTDLYISKDRMVVIGLEQNGVASRARTITKLYDITDRAKPTVLEEFAQSGYHVSSRLTNGILYVFSNVSYYSEPDKSELSTYIPHLYDSNGACPVEENSICIFDGEVDRQYMLATSVDIDLATRVDSVSVLGGGDTIYANTESIYVAAEQCTFSYLEQEDVLLKKYENTTRLIRLGIEKGELTAAAEGYVRGSILNQFSMDEYQNHFRIVTTVNGSISEDEETSDSKSSNESGEISSSEKNNAEENSSPLVSSASSQNVSSVIATMDTTTTNALFVLDRNLKQVGRIINLAPGERVYSVRFMGDYGYFVTFRNVDPLFAVDLTNPEKPKVLSALKIPGFSNYLHPYGESLLLGIGKNADEITGRTDTVKLSMFDISDPTNVTERDKTSLDCTYTQVDSTHKAALIDEKHNLIAFMGSDSYYVYGYTKENGFVQKAKLQVNWMAEYDVRGLYIGDYFYVCTPRGIDSYKLNNFEFVSSLRFNKTK